MSYKLLGDKEVYTVNETYNKEEVNEIQESLEQHLDTAVEEYLDESHTVETRVNDYVHSEEGSEAIKEEVGNNYYDKQAADERFANLNSPHLAGHPTTPNASKLPVDTGVWKIGDEFVDVAMHPTTEPIGEVQSVTLLGSIVDYGSHYYIKVEDAWYEVTGLATDRILYDSDPVTDEAVIAVLEASDTTPVNYDVYHAEVDDNQQIANLKYVDDALQSAKDYADSEDTTTLQSAKSYADSEDATTLQSAKDYSDSGDAATLQSAKDYSDSGDATTLQAAKNYTDSGDATTLQAAKNYADSGDATTLQAAKNYADSGDATTLQAAKNYTDQHVPEMTAANVDYSNTDSGLSATDVQGAIDELAAGGGSGGTSDYADLTNKPQINGQVLVANEDGHTYRLVNMSDLPFEETPERTSITTQRGITNMPLYSTDNARNFKFAVYHDAIYLVNTEGPNSNYLFKSTDGLNYSPVTAYTEYANDIFVWQDKLWICSTDHNNNHGPICWTTDAVTFNWECGEAVTERNDNSVNAYCFSDEKLYLALFNDGFGGYGVWETTGNGTWVNTPGYAPDSGYITCIWHTSTGIVAFDSGKESPFSRNGTALQMQTPIRLSKVVASGVFQDYAYLVTYYDGSGDSYLYLIAPDSNTVIEDNIGVITFYNPVFLFKDKLYKIPYDNVGNDYNTIYYKDTPTSEWQSLTLYDTSTVDNQLIPQFCVYRENGEDVALYAALANGQNNPNLLVYSFDGETFAIITSASTMYWLATYYGDNDSVTPLSQPTVSFNDSIIAITADPSDLSNGLPLIIEGPLPAGNPELQFDTAPTKDSPALMKSGDVYDSITKLEQVPTDTFTQNSSFPASYTVNAITEYNGKLYIGTSSYGIFVSSDGETFTQNTSFPEYTVYVFCEYDGKLYAGTNGHGVYESSDGITFTQNTSFPTSYYVYALAVYDGKLYVGTDGDHGVYISFDGNTFTQNTSFPTNYSVYALAKYDGKLYVGTYNHGVYISSDGETFTQNTSFPTSYYVYALAEYDGKLYVGTGSNGIYVFDGETFTHNISFSTSYTVNVLAEYDGKLYVGTHNHGVYISSDGETFTQNTSFPTSYTVKAFAVYDGKLYVGTSSHGLYQNDTTLEVSPFIQALVPYLKTIFQEKS